MLLVAFKHITSRGFKMMEFQSSTSMAVIQRPETYSEFLKRLKRWGSFRLLAMGINVSLEVQD